MINIQALRSLWARMWLGATQMTAGGKWSYQLPEGTQNNLRAFFFDGLFASASDNILLTYFTLFLLTLGATNTDIGAMTALASLSATLLLIPGAMLAERSKKRKAIVLLTGGGIRRLLFLLLALLPLFIQGSTLIYAAIGIKVIADALANLGLPAWVAMTGDIVPLAWRGRYFGTRNLAMGVAAMLVTYLIGQLITTMGEMAGHQWALGIAFGVGAVATFSFARIKEPPVTTNDNASQGYSPKALLNTLRGDPAFMNFCGFTILWGISVQMAAPFFTVFMVKELNATAFEVGMLAIVSQLASLPALRFFGQLNDRWGARRVTILTALIIPILPFAWLVVSSPWHIVPINLLAGVCWAGFGLASFNFLLTISPEDQRPRYSAIYQICVSASAALGAYLGGYIATQWSMLVLFALSGIGRLVSALYFARFARKNPLPVDESLGAPGQESTRG